MRWFNRVLLAAVVGVSIPLWTLVGRSLYQRQEANREASKEEFLRDNRGFVNVLEVHSQKDNTYTLLVEGMFTKRREIVEGVFWLNQIGPEDGLGLVLEKRPGERSRYRIVYRASAR